jgi:hypothetical protein
MSDRLNGISRNVAVSIIVIMIVMYLLMQDVIVNVKEQENL